MYEIDDPQAENRHSTDFWRYWKNYNIVDIIVEPLVKASVSEEPIEQQVEVIEQPYDNYVHSFGKSYNYNENKDRKQHLVDGDYKCTRMTANEAVAEYFKRFKVIKQDSGKFHVCGILHMKLENHYYYCDLGVDCQTEEEGQSLIRDKF